MPTFDRAYFRNELIGLKIVNRHFRNEPIGVEHVNRYFRNEAIEVTMVTHSSGMRRSDTC